MRIYVAAPYEDKKLAEQLAAKLTAAGHTITSTWLNEGGEQGMNELDRQKGGRAAICLEYARRDLHEIDIADAVIKLSYEHSHKKSTGGNHVELGYALGKGKLVAIRGKKENVFHYLPTVSVCETDEEAVTWANTAGQVTKVEPDEEKVHDPVNQPRHYDYKHEPIDVIEDWSLPFHLGCTVKYLARYRRKGKPMQDLRKARWYLDRYINANERDPGGSLRGVKAIACSS